MSETESTKEGRSPNKGREYLERFGIGTRHANEYAKIVLARLKIRKKFYTKWGFI